MVGMTDGWDTASILPDEEKVGKTKFLAKADFSAPAVAIPSGATEPAEETGLISKTGEEDAMGAVEVV